MSEAYTQWYPYLCVQDSYFKLEGAEKIPRKICDYLIDAPKGEYMPPDDNAYSRCRLWKYLYYDGAKPLGEPLPTIHQKMSVVFDADSPEKPPTDKGYRLIPQVYIKPAQTDAQTRIYVYMGRTVPSNDEFKICIGVNFFIWTHYTYESNTKSDEYSRCFAIEQAIIEALHGVSMDGIGTFFMAKSKHPDCGSKAIFDGDTNVGRQLTIALEIATTANKIHTEFENMPLFGNNPNIRLG